MKNILLLFVLSFWLIPNATAQLDLIEDIQECIFDLQNETDTTDLVDYAPNGLAFTPKGDLRMLVIYVNFSTSTAQDHDDLDGWPFNSEFPVLEDNVTSVVDLNTGELAFAHDEFSDFSSLGSPSTTAYRNLSEYYYHMSNGAFRLYVETIKDPVTGTPKSITIDPSQTTDPGNVNVLAKTVIETIATTYPTYDWSRFDLRGGTPSWDQDLSTPCDNNDPNNLCDNKLDYVFIIYRNSNCWEPHPNGAANISDANHPGCGAASGWPGGVASLGTNASIGGGYTVGRGFRRHHLKNSRYYTNVSLPIHEIGHTYMSASHTGRANGVHGKYFFSNYAWSMTSGYYSVNALANAYERWYSGWTEITHDLDGSQSSSGTYILRDYMDYNESMRIKIPHTADQFIWLENHANPNPFYERIILRKDKNGDDIPMQTEGLYGFVERIAPTRFDINRFVFGNNGIKIIHGKGNHDYKFNGFYQAPYLWPASPAVMKLDKLRENPYGGHNEASHFRLDLLPEGNPDGEITHDPDANRGGPNEGYAIWEVDDQAVYGWMLPDVKLPNRKLSAFSNPALTNFQEYISAYDVLSPIVLHSLSVTPTASSKGDYSIVVDYNDGNIENDFRMTGNVLLPSNESIKLNPSKVLTLNRTETPNVSKSSSVSDNTFYDQSVFILEEESSLTLQTKSRLILDEGTTMIVEGDSELNFDSKAALFIRNGSLLCIKEFANINFGLFSRIVVEDGYLVVHPSIDISSNVQFSGDHFVNPIISNVVNFCGTTNNPEHLHSTDGTYVSGLVCNNTVMLNNTDRVKLTSEEFIQIDSDFEVPVGAFFDAEILTIADDCDKQFYFGTNTPTEEGGDSSSDDRTKKESLPAFHVNVIPNPSNGNFEVQIDKTLASFTYTLFDFSGNVVLENRKQNANLFSIAQSGLLAGIYILEVVSQNDVVSVKVVVNK